MSGLLLKDFFVITKQLKLFLILSLLMLLSGNALFIVYIVLFFAIIPMTAIAYDEQCKWNEFAVMMPYDTKLLVISKYVLGYLGMIFAVILSFVSMSLINLIRFGTINFSDNISIILMAIGSALIFIGLNLLIVFKFGVEKGRLVFIFVIIAASVGGSILGEISESVSGDFLINLIGFMPVLLIVVGIVVNIISIALAIKIKSK